MHTLVITKTCLDKLILDIYNNNLANVLKFTRPLCSSILEP